MRHTCSVHLAGDRLDNHVAGTQLIMEVVKHLEGAYALLIKSTAYPGELVACKRGSPLILGIKVSMPACCLPR